MQGFLERQLALVTKISTSARSHWRTLLVRGILIAAGIVLVVMLGKMLEADIGSIENWLRDQGAWTPIIFSLLFIFAILFCVPADIFAFTAGTLFGLWWGFLVAAIAEWIAMAIQFYLARSLLKNRIERFLRDHKRFRAIDNAISQQGLRIGFLLRLGPVPFSPLSYTLGMSKIDFKTYMLASIGMLPSLLAVVYYGVVAQHLTKFATGMENHSWVHYASMIGGIVVFMFVTMYTAKIASKALREANAL